MFSHVMLGTNEIERSKRFDDAVTSGYEAAVAALQRPHGLFQQPATDAIGSLAGWSSLETAD